MLNILVPSGSVYFFEEIEFRSCYVDSLVQYPHNCFFGYDFNGVLEEQISVSFVS